MRILNKYLKKYYPRMALGFSIKSIGTLSELMLPYILSHILTNVLGKNVGEIIMWGGLMVLFSAIACSFNIVANRMAAKVSRNFAEALRRDLFYKTLHLSARQTDKFTIPSLESRITTDTYNVHHFVNMIQRLGVRAPMLLIGGIAVTLVMDAYLSLVMISMLPLMFIVVYFISRKGVPLYTKVQKRVDSMVRVVREDAHGIRVIKALSKTDYENRRFDKVNRELVGEETKSGVIMGSVNPIMTLFMNMGSVAVIAIGAHRVTGSLSSAETVIAFMQYFTLISNAMMSVTRMFVMYTKSAASARRISEVLYTEEEQRVEAKEKFPDIKTDAHIKFDKVCFSYNGKRNNLTNIDFEIKKGESLGIIGATGAGKSTIVKLLLRFYDANSGGIYINGEDIRTVEKSRLYEMFGSALQHDFLYADTIEENIRFGRNAVSHDDVERATKTAQAEEFIKAFPEGYEHVLSQHGTNISGGQKQRLLISRAICTKPDILILDDSSSALDYKTDAALRRALKEQMAGTTVVTVAQRVSSIKDCELIIVLDEGRIIGMGDHSCLMENCSEYNEIALSQMGGAFVD
ncbi:MAG: ABC transporter ATP-binding protein [Clostridia bacterium]|nr:ABC transporter ATP-binding protein [Clostridia bacterium]